MQTLEERFWSKVEKIPFHICWEWTASKCSSGYGNICFKKRTLSAHRISWEIHFGKIPKNGQVLHKCDNPGCVNPGHLWIGNNAQNMRDKSEKGRINGIKNPNAKLTEESVIKIRKLHENGFSKRQLGKTFGIHENHIGKIIFRQRWKHI